MAATRVHSLVAKWVARREMMAVPRREMSAAAAAAIVPRATEVGILAMESYVAGRAVSQSALEKFDGVGTGKYTVGLGQQQMAFVDDREDINSVCLTAVQRLLDNYNIDPRAIGRLEVGTESLVDKSKSTKTTLMQLFEAAGNRDIEGATVMNACYGGTAAFFNSAAWVESSQWDGRYALFVAADIAVYAKGPARPTGGIGAVAALVGPNAPLRLVPRTRATHAMDVYDFYKPSLGSEYPAVDGKLSQTCYLRAVDDCYNMHMDRVQQSGAARGGSSRVAGIESQYDHMLFHSPYNKLVQQSYRRMLWNDARRAAQAGVPLPEHLAGLEKFLSLPYEATLTSKELDKALAEVPGGGGYARSVGPTVGLSQRIGNSYTAALWSNLVSTVSQLGQEVDGRQLGLFSYGSGAIASMFALEGVANKEAEKVNPLFTNAGIKKTVDIDARLAARKEATPEEFTEALAMREASYGKANFKPVGSVDNVPAGGWYLSEVAANHTRMYARK